MKKLLFILFFFTVVNSYSQMVVQTYTDRCSGVVYTFTVPYDSSTVVTFYNKSKVFTAAEFTNGTLQAWLEETYLWWSQLSPCSANQATATTAQQTTQQTTSAATEAASSAASSAASAAPPATDTSTTNTTSTNASSSTDSTASTSGGDTTSSSQSTDSSSSSSSESSSTETSDTSSGGESTEDSGGGETPEPESEPTEETSSEPTEETSSEESSESEGSSESEEKVEEESSEESSESEESESEESESEEESTEESSEDSEDSKEEDEKKEKKKNLAPPILASNLASMQMLDGTWSTAASFGLSQSSLTGQETYSANLMLWSNFKQFSLGVGKSKLHFWSEYEDMAWTINQKTGQKVPAINFHTKERYVDRQNKIHHIGSFSANYMYLYGTSVITAGYSAVYLGQKEDFFQGFAGGFAATNSIIILPESTLYSPALTLFGTKPLNFKALPRWSFAPMLAISLTPLQIINSKNEFNKNQAQFVWNKYFTYIIGNNINFNLTQRFTANLGINTINNTNSFVPTTFAITIGARFAF